MADAQAGEMPPAVESYVQDREIDFPYRLLEIGHDDGSNMDKIKTNVAKASTTATAADNSPVSEAGTAQSWEMITPDDANNAAAAD
ncbi:hypothetical protein J3F84DRAFT_2263 [Trichoderma pleuroticola]